MEATGITLPPVDDTKAIDLQPTEKIGYLALTQERVRAENRVTGSDAMKERGLRSS